ncbi:alpha/beta hydrolase [Streptomyces thermocarboxydus]
MAETHDGTFTTSEEWFDSAGTRCAARVYRPTDADQPLPVIVMAHGFGAVRALRLYAYAERFASAGYAVVVFDYRNFGESEGEPRQVLDIGMQHEDWRAALRYARSLEGIDHSRIVAWGTSFAAVTSSPSPKESPRRRHRSGPARQRPGSGEVDRPAGRPQGRRAGDPGRHRLSARS